MSRGTEPSAPPPTTTAPHRPVPSPSSPPCRAGSSPWSTAPVRLVRPRGRRLRPTSPPAAPGCRLAAAVAAFVVPAFVLAVLVKVFVAQAYYIPSTSMQPQLDVGDRVLVSRLSYRLHEPRRGDVVVFDEPGADGDHGTLPMRTVRSVARGARRRHRGRHPGEAGGRPRRARRWRAGRAACSSTAASCTSPTWPGSR